MSQAANAAYSGFVMPVLRVILLFGTSADTCVGSWKFERVVRSLASEMAEIVPGSSTFTD
jgi:hypothetical protein